MWLNELLVRGMILAQSPTPAGPLTPIKYEVLDPTGAAAGGVTTPQWIMLIIYAIICLGLIGCVTMQTSKSEGLMQQMMGGAAPTYKGKKSAEDNLTSVANWLAFAFIALSILMCLVFH